MRLGLELEFNIVLIDPNPIPGVFQYIGRREHTTLFYCISSQTPSISTYDNCLLRVRDTIKKGGLEGNSIQVLIAHIEGAVGQRIYDQQLLQFAHGTQSISGPKQNKGTRGRVI